MSKHITLRLRDSFLEELDKFGRIMQCKNRPQALYKLMEKYLELTNPKIEIPSQFTIGTKVKCLSRNGYFDLMELPCVASNIFCTNEECFKRVQKLFEQRRH
jgi:hypothetical protein